MRVLHVISDMDPRSGGTVSAVAHLACGQAQAGAEVRIFTTHPDRAGTPPSDDFRRNGVGFVEARPAIRYVGFRPGVARAIRREVDWADVVHIHALWEYPQWVAARACRKRGTPYVLSPHGMLDAYGISRHPWIKGAMLRLWVRRIVESAAMIHLTHCREGAALAEPRWGDRAVVAWLGFDLTAFSRVAPDAILSRWPQLAGRQVVLFLGRLHAKKNPDVLIQALRHCPDAVLLLVGPGDDTYVASLKQLAAAEGLADRAVFAGMLQGDMRLAAYSVASCMVLPSQQENFAMSVVEAMLCGCPVICSPGVALSDDVRREAMGWVCPPEPAALGLAMGAVLADPGAAAARAVRAIDFCRSRLDRRVLGEWWVSAYAAILSGRLPASPGETGSNG